MQRKIGVKELSVSISTNLEGQKVAQNCPGDLFWKSITLSELAVSTYI